MRKLIILYLMLMLIIISGCNSSKSLQVDLSQCDSIGEIREREFCYAKLARSSGDEKICAKIESPYDKQCYGNIAIDKKDITVCDGLTNLEQKEECIAGVAVQEEDLTVCKNLGTPKLKGECIKQIAFKKNDADICSQIEYQRELEFCNNFFSRNK